MRKTRNKRVITSSNLDTATPEQMDKVYTNVAQAVSTMYRSVVESGMKN